jgi:outer membrane protein OmpA-like peptidoglycan-associated protein
MKRTLMALTLGAGLLCIRPAPAVDVNLTAVLYPDNKSVDIPFTTVPRAPRARLEGSVKLRSAQALIEISYKNLQPALLFGGDVTSYAVWAVTRDGVTENLGELVYRDGSNSFTFQSGQKNFALMITAEPHPYGIKPSDIVCFTSGAADPKRARSSVFTFSGGVPGVKTSVDTIAGLTYKHNTPVDLAQAQKILRMAEAMKAEILNPNAMRDARIALSQAEGSTKPGGSAKAVVDYARRSIALASEAIRDVQRKAAADAAETEAARKKAELDAMTQSAASAESARAQTAQALVQTEAARQQTAQALSETEAARQRAEATIAQAKMEMERLAAERSALKRERDELAERLSGALNKVMQTMQTARGLVMSLGDITFDLGKATVRQSAKISLAKLSGILLLVPDVNVRVEGFTDSTGSETVNMKLSAARAKSVADFLTAQGVDAARITHQGYGPKNPVTGNETKEGRARNRRVELIFARGAIKPT